MVGPLTRERPEPQVGEVAADGPTSKPRRGPVRAAIVALRPQEWVKNLLVYAGLLFSAKFTDLDAIVAATVTFAAFCMISSAGYLVNDAHDVDEDRQHPKKKFRPIAAGELPIPTAIGLAVVLAVLALAGSAALEGLEVGGLVLAYAVGTTLYSYALKHEVILDVMTIAGLFVLRVLAGAVAVDADASSASPSDARRQPRSCTRVRSRDRCSSTTPSPSSIRWSRWSPRPP
jgi:decaprenyl-phosphate phosphoribosyltransferase